jgi:hypothetical protein
MTQIRNEIQVSEEITNKLICDTVNNMAEDIDGNYNDLKRYVYNCTTNFLKKAYPGADVKISDNGVPDIKAVDGLVAHISPLGK